LLNKKCKEGDKEWKSKRISFWQSKDVGKYTELLAVTDQDVLAGYGIQIESDEIWITEKVLNMVFVKPGAFKK